MKIYQKIIVVIGIILIIISWYSWKYDYSLPFYSYSFYGKIGLLLIAIVTLGDLIGLLAIWGSLIPLLVIAYKIVFEKDASWESINATKYLIIFGWMFGAGLICRILGIKIAGEAIESFREGWSKSPISSTESETLFEPAVEDSGPKWPPKCRHCGTSGYGKGCPWGPNKIHVHGPDGKHCVYCGGKQLFGPNCPFSPDGNHASI
mgnify:CR=1 FL=1